MKLANVRRVVECAYMFSAYNSSPKEKVFATLSKLQCIGAYLSG